MVEAVRPSNYVRKAPYNYGWEWGPRFITSGIWRSVEIEFWDAARIDNVYVRQLDVSKVSANLSVETDVVAGETRRVRVELDESRWFPPAADLSSGPRQKLLAQWLRTFEQHKPFCCIPA